MDKENWNADAVEILVREYIKNNLRIEVRRDEKFINQNQTYESKTFVELVLNGEVISSKEIDGLYQYY